VVNKLRNLRNPPAAAEVYIQPLLSY